MSDVEKLEEEIEAARKKLGKLRLQKSRQLKVAKLQVKLQKARMETRLDELLRTPFARSVRKIMIEVAENQVVEALRKSFEKGLEEGTSHPNKLVI